jgi:beta-glucosidase
VVFGETPYAEFQGDVADLDFHPDEPLAILQRLRAAGIPTVAVFLSGRPLYVNPEINASNAFVAAWLPGSEGGGIADVLVADAAGAPRTDFHGTLPFSWPRTPDQVPQNAGSPGYDPQFPLGYGLAYGRPAVTSRLAEVEVERGESDRILYGDGRFTTPWSLVLRDEGGESRVADGARGASPRSRVQVAPVDGTAQESARKLIFSGPGRAIITGPALDLTGTAEDHHALIIRFRIDQGVSDDFQLGIGDQLTGWPAATGTGWQEATIPLRCLPGAGAASFASVDRFLIVEAARPAALSIEDVRLVRLPHAPCR